MQLKIKHFSSVKQPKVQKKIPYVASLSLAIKHNQGYLSLSGTSPYHKLCQNQTFLPPPISYVKNVKLSQLPTAYIHMQEIFLKQSLLDSPLASTTYRQLTLPTRTNCWVNLGIFTFEGLNNLCSCPIATNHLKYTSTIPLHTTPSLQPNTKALCI